MNASKMTASSHDAAPESLPEKRHDGLKPENTALKREDGQETCLRKACQKLFKPERKNQRHCSPQCRKKHYFETHFVRIA